MRKVVRLIVCAAVAAGATFAMSGPASAVCPQSHGGGCDPCPAPDAPETPVSIEIAISSWLFDNCIQ